MRRLLVYIDQNLGEDLSLDALSAIASFSKFHLHRQLASTVGMGVHKYVRLARLKRASYKLAFRGGESVLDIALESGYEGPEAFARAFRIVFGQSPSEFRARPDWASWHAAFEEARQIRRVQMKQEFQSEQVQIVEVADTRVAVLEHRGDPARVGDSVREFIAWRKQAGLSPKVSGTYNILYDDPNLTPASEFRLDICASTEYDVPPNEAGVVPKFIPGGRCAVLRHIGTEEGFADAIRYLYAVWLPESGEELRDFPLYCQRVRFFPDVAEHEAVTDIFLPLK